MRSLERFADRQNTSARLTVAIGARTSQDPRLPATKGMQFNFAYYVRQPDIFFDGHPFGTVSSFTERSQTRQGAYLAPVAKFSERLYNYPFCPYDPGRPV